MSKLLIRLQMAGFMQAIVEAFGNSKDLFLKLGVAVVTYLVILVIVGIFAQLIASGTIAVPSAINTSAQALVTSMLAIGVLIMASITTVAGFIVISVLVAVFGPMLGFNMGSKKSSRRRRF